ncbi:uncharacterized protein LOC110975854 [Acanthaster planci]|uniref:Structure-specific endonuclease subunit SLX4 n=1 Tax=Acanthaster planci TaxID=133434 RepID=A0A8B7XWG3_ACAPL|nr:uncharacterized protein LOC110975854 [Acanthaster planci]
MNEMPQEQTPNNASQSDCGKLSARTEDGHPELNDTNIAQKSAGQQNVPDKTDSVELCRASGDSNPSKTSSRIGRLSRRRDAGRLGPPGKHNPSSASAHREVMKAILGETSLNQSSDFKEPWSRGPALQEPGCRRKADTSLSRLKGSKASKTQTSGSVNQSAPDTLDHSEPTTSKEEKQSRGQLNTPESSVNVKTRSYGDAVNTPTSVNKSPVKACLVYVSRLKLSSDSQPAAKLNCKVAVSDEPLEPMHLSNPATDTSTGCSEAESKPASLPETSNFGDGDARNEPPADQARDNLRRCPVCQETFHGINATETIQQHVERCLRQRFANSVQARDYTGNSGDTSGDEEFARQLQRREEEKLEEERLTDSERYFCHLCQRDLSHMNTTRRAQHINRCIDTIEAIEPPQRPVRIQPVRQAVPDCPVCGKHFSTKRQRESHLKKCARKHEVSAQQLIALVRVQEEELPRNEGSVGVSVGSSTRSSTGGSSGSSSGSARGGSVQGRSIGGSVGGSDGGSSRGFRTGEAGSSVGGLTGSATEGSEGGSAVGSVGGSTRGCNRGALVSSTVTAGLEGGLEGTSAGAKAAAASVKSDTGTARANSVDALGSAGIAVSSGSSATRGRGGRKGSRGRNGTRGKGRQKHQTPVETQPLDEETQMALALSASLVQQPDAKVSMGEAAAQSSGTAPKPTGKMGRKKRTGKKLENKEVPLLLRRTVEERSQVLGARMADLVVPQERTSVKKTPSMKRSRVARRHQNLSPRKPRTCIHLAEAAAAASQQAHQEEDLGDSSPGKKSKPVPLWSLASASSSSSQMPFYVRQLLPVVTPQKPASARRAHVAVGPTTPGKQSQAQPSQSTSLSDGTPRASMQSPGSASFRSQEGFATQTLGRTLQILAELAAESAPPPCTQSSDHSLAAASGFILTEEEDREEKENQIVVNHYQSNILQQLSELVNSKDLCDLHLVPSDGSVICAHHFLISLRCPSLAKLVKDTSTPTQVKTLDLQDFSRESVLCALDFIYAGKVTVTSFVAEDIWKFAKRFSLPQLCDICCKFNSNLENTMTSPEGNKLSLASISDLSPETKKGVEHDNDEFFANRGLDDLIQSLWESRGEESDSHKGDSDNASDKDGGDQKAPASQARRRFSHQVSDTESDSEVKDEAPNDRDMDEIYEFFSTQRQQRQHQSSAEKCEDTSEEDSDDAASDGDDGHDDMEYSEKCSATCGRRSFTILEQLQSSCLPQGPGQGSQRKEDTSSQGDVCDEQGRCCVTPEQISKRRKSVTSSSGVADSIDSSSDLITPCFVHMKKLSNDLPVSPMKSTQTVGKCLEQQSNLRAKPAKCARNHEEVLGEGCRSLKEADATLADVGDSIFQSCDDSKEDVKEVDFDTWKATAQHHENSQEINQASVSQCSRTDVEGDQCTFNQSEDLLETFSIEREEMDVEEVESCKNAPSDGRDTSSSSESEVTLPEVNVRSQPDKQVSHSLEIRHSFGQPGGSGEEMSSVKEPELRIPMDARVGAQDAVDNVVIDLSQDENDQEIEAVDLKTKDNNAAVDNRDIFQDNANDSARDEDMSVIFPRSPVSVASRSKTLSQPSQNSHHTRKPSPREPPVTKPQKFTFRRRDRQGNTAANPAGKKDLKNLRIPALHGTEGVKPKSSDTLASVIETPAAFRAAADLVRDSSTPLFGPNSRTVAHHHSDIPPEVSPVKNTPAVGQGQRVGGQTRKEGTHLSSLPLESKSSDGLDHNMTSRRGRMMDGSPVLKPLPKKYHSRKGQDVRETTSTETRDKSSSPFSRSNFTIDLEHSSGEEDNGPDSLHLSGTPVGPTPDCFDADTPEVISSVPPAPLSPSPPPSPTFGSVCSLKAKDWASTSSEQQNVVDTIVDEGIEWEGSLASRCKRKLQQEDYASEDVEVPSKRPKGLSSQTSHSAISTNLLSPVCTTDEDDVILVSNDGENQDGLRTDTRTVARRDKVNWLEQLCVGLSPTRFSSESQSSDETEDSHDCLQDASTPRIQPNNTPGYETTASLKKCSLSMSSFKTSGSSNTQASPSNSPRPASRSPSPPCSTAIRDATSKRSQPETLSSPQDSASDVESVPPASPENASQEQFAYYGDDGGGYMEDFNFCSDGEGASDEADMEDVKSERKSQTGTETSGLRAGGAGSLLEKLSASCPTTRKSTSGMPKGFHSNISVQNFSSSDEDSHPPRPESLPTSQHGGGAGVLLGSKPHLKEEAEEFGCSESFLCELRAGQVDEEVAWGGVLRADGDQDIKQPQNKCPPEDDPLVSKTTMVRRKEPLSKETIDKLYHPPAPITPMPPYDDMNTPGLKNELKKFGVKPLPKKKARLKLKEIYSYTHQVLEDSDSESDGSGPTFKLPAVNTKSTTSSNPPTRKAAPKKSPTRRKKSNSKEGSSGQQLSQKRAGVSRPGHLEAEVDGDSQSMDSDDSEYSNSRECPEGTDDEEDDEDFLEPSQRTAANLEEAIKVYIKTRPSLYEKILCYEPLELDKFHAELKRAGIKYSKNKLREFLDYHGITFRVITSNANRQVRKPKKAKSK